MSKTLLKMTGITKQFPGVLALDNVNLTLHEGEILALVGENGAGKSTLLKILSGAYKKDKGSIMFNGKIIDDYTPNDAINMGISIIYQELDNYPTLSVAENVLVNALPKRGGKYSPLNRGEIFQKADGIIKQLTDEIDVKEIIGTLPAAKQQLCEIAKAMSRNMKVLIMDEPTSALNNAETEHLMQVIRALADSGIAIVYISHRMDEIFDISDRIQVMRDGKSVSSFMTADTNQEEIIREMVGRQLDEMYPHEKLEAGECILKVENLECGKSKNVSFDLRRGEIIGLFGLMGAGRTSVARGIFGDLSIHSGRLLKDGKEMKFNSPKDAIKNGIAYVPNERKLEGLMLINSVAFNTNITVVDKLAKGFGIDRNKEKDIAKKWIEKLNVKTPSMNTVVNLLSGGNQQKVVISKWLETNPDVLILNDPTRGIDVGAKAEIYSLMEELCRQGIGIIMISSELKETLSMADRILVMCEGELTGEVPIEEATQERLMKLAVGGIRDGK